MFVDVVRMVRAALEHASEGVNALLPTLDLDGADTAPAAVSVFDETTDNVSAFGKLPATLPCVVVAAYRVDALEPVSVNLAHLDSDCTVFVRLGTKDSQTARGVRDAMYLQWGIVRALQRFHTDTRAADRQRNSTQLVGFGPMSWVANVQPVAGAEIVSGLLVPYTVRNLNV